MFGRLWRLTCWTVRLCLRFIRGAGQAIVDSTTILLGEDTKPPIKFLTGADFEPKVWKNTGKPKDGCQLQRDQDGNERIVAERTGRVLKEL